MRLLLIILPLFLSFFAFSEEYILFISTEKEGVIISAVPATKQYEPTKAELQRYKIVTAELSETEVAQLLEPEVDAGSGVMLSERKIKLDVKKLKDKKQKEKVSKGGLKYASAVSITSLNN